MLAVWYFIHEYRTGQAAKAQVAVIQAKLDAETSCLVGSICADRTRKEAEESVKAVQAVQDAADQQNAKTQADNQAKEQAAAQVHIQTVKQLQSQLADRDKKLAEISLHDAPCKKWLDEKIACDIQ